MTNKMETKNFTTKESYLECLQKLLNQLAQRGDYIIYLHEMSPDMNVKEPDPRRIIATEKTANSIATYGLDTSDYGSIAGTAKKIGEAKDVNAQEIYDYVYYGCHAGAMRAVAIMAFPKYIEIDGKQLEYGTCSEKEKIHKIVKEAGISPRGDHSCVCLYDCIKRWPVFAEDGKTIAEFNTYVPLEYMLGIQEIIEEDDDYRLLLPHTHLAEIGESSRKKHFAEAEFLIKEWAETCGTFDVPTMIAKKTISDYSYWEEHEWFDDSGW